MEDARGHEMTRITQLEAQQRRRLGAAQCGTGAGKRASVHTGEGRAGVHWCGTTRATSESVHLGHELEPRGARKLVHTPGARTRDT